MKYGYIKVATASPKISVAAVSANTNEICRLIDKADREGVNLLVFPELTVTGYTCGDLFYSDLLLGAAFGALAQIARFTSGKYPLVIVGAPLKFRGKLFNCAVCILNGKILAAIPKTNLPNYGEFYDKRQFESGENVRGSVKIGEDNVPIDRKIVLRHSTLPDFAVGVEVCEDLWAPNTPSTGLCRAGATVVANTSASNEIIGKADYRRLLVSSTSARLICGYVYCNAGMGESTQDLVFSQHHIICENGAILSENLPFGENELTLTEIDVGKISYERHRNTSFTLIDSDEYREVVFEQEVRNCKLTRLYHKNPFVPSDDEVEKRAEAILMIQAHGLKKRLAHIHSKTAVIGISGGLDSCLALLVMVRAFDLMKKDRKDIIAVTMPCFGTTKRTRSNAEQLCIELGVTFMEVDITSAVDQHFSDIGHPSEIHDVTYENSQARERTQVLMDMAGKYGGIVVGTGDLSELALGWATYNGDHMSMYGVNASVPKTLVKYIVKYEAKHAGGNLKNILEDIYETPVSPELLPANSDGTIAQVTEDLVGPYELHDFFLYHLVRCGERPSKVYYLAKYAFDGEYSDETIKKWLITFVRRFFAQQFKRSCIPDGPKVGSVTLSPRGDWRMPSDVVSADWLEDLANL